MSLSVIVVDDEPITRIDIVQMLTQEGFDVLGQACDGFEAIELCKKLNPDVIIMDLNMPKVDGFKACEVIRRDNLAKEIVVITAYSDIKYVKKATDHDVYSYIVKPLTEEKLIPILHLLAKRCGELEKLKNQIDDLKSDIDSRKIVEKAKGYIMKEKNLSEDMAYTYIRRLSMDKRKSMAEIADAILKLYE